MRGTYRLTGLVAASALLSMFGLAGCGGTGTPSSKGETKATSR